MFWVAALLMGFSGCDGLHSADYVAIRSIYLDNEYLVLNVTALGTDYGMNEGGACFYYTDLAYDDIIAELEGNGIAIYECEGDLTFTYGDTAGLYRLRIEESPREDFSYIVYINDMRCEFSGYVDGTYTTSCIPFPYIATSGGSGYKVDTVYDADMDLLMYYLDKMGVYTVEWVDDSLTLEYAGQGILVQAVSDDQILFNFLDS